MSPTTITTSAGRASAKAIAGNEMVALYHAFIFTRGRAIAAAYTIKGKAGNMYTWSLELTQDMATNVVRVMHRK